MRLYSGGIDQFRQDVLTNRIADLLASSYQAYYNRRVSPSEYHSWENSLRLMKDSLDIVSLKDCYIAVEHELPYSARRIDVVLFGKGENSDENVVIVELKQWSEVKDSGIEGNVLTAIGGGLREVPHPSSKVEGYYYELFDFYSEFEEKPKLTLNACVYCHNYDAQKHEKSGTNVLFAQNYQDLLSKYPVFAKHDVKKLGNYLKERLSSGDGLQVFNRFDRSAVRPSKRLIQEFGGMVRGQQIFNLIDDQIAAYNAIKAKVNSISKTKQKSVIIIKGGPGTGKSVIALEVLAEMMKKGKTAFYATGSSALTNTLRKIAGSRASMFFKYFYSFTRHQDDEIDLLICDEAHRLRAHSNDWGVPYQFKSKSPQVDDVIRPARVTVFFIDEHQVVRPTEIGSVEMIRESAKKFGAEIYEYELRTQFRCSGSDSYLQWLDKVLGITESEITQFDAKMQFKIFDSPTEMMTEIRARNKEKPNSARITAGFCWPWSEPNKDGSLVNDVKVDNFQMPWENKKEFWKWATDESGMEQVGTVYTAQGFEFDYIGVIFGKDLIYDSEKRVWVAQRENSYDKQVTRKNNEKLVDHFKNVYRVLMSRAHKGVYVYFMDKETERHFKDNLKEMN